MENQPFPDTPGDWTWGTIELLAGEEYRENAYLEYKSRLQYPSDSEKSKSEWKRNIEREFVAFANASGGYIVFGMDEPADISLAAAPDHELGRAIADFVQNTKPTVRTTVSDPLRPPDGPADRLVLAVKVDEAPRKPVATSDSAFYVRINDQKQPMGRDLIRSFLVEADRRQQAVRELELEFDRVHDLRNTPARRPFDVHSEAAPNYHSLNTDSLKEALRRNTHLYTNDDARDAISRIFRELNEIEDDQVYVQRVLSGVVESPYSEDRFYRKHRQELQSRIEALEREFRTLAKVADLQTKYGEDVPE